MVSLGRQHCLSCRENPSPQHHTSVNRALMRREIRRQHTVMELHANTLAQKKSLVFQDNLQIALDLIREEPSRVKVKQEGQPAEERWLGEAKGVAQNLLLES